MKHYIIVEVREPVDERNCVDGNRRISDVGLIRTALHKLCEESGFDASDVIVRGDRDVTFYGDRSQFPAVEALWNKIMAPVRELFAAASSGKS